MGGRSWRWYVGLVLAVVIAVLFLFFVGISLGSIAGH